MATISSINLIQSKTDENPEITQIAVTLTKICYGMVLTLIISGFLVGGVYSYLQIRNKELTTQKQVLLTGISHDAPKESLLAALKARVSVVNTIISNQKHVGTLFDLVNTIVPAGALTSLTLDDTNKTVITMNIGSISEALIMVDSLLNEADKGKLTKPELMSLALAKEGGFVMVLSFVPEL